MAAEVTIEMELKITGLGTSDTVVKVKSAVDGTTIEEKLGPHYAIIGNSALNLDLGYIEETDLLGVLIIAKAGNIGILVDDDGTGTPSATAGNMVINTGEPVFIPLPGGLTNGQYIRLLGSTSTTAIEYHLFGKHT